MFWLLLGHHDMWLVLFPIDLYPTCLIQRQLLSMLSKHPSHWSDSGDCKLVELVILCLLGFQVLDRGERIELLVDKTENLQFQVLSSFHLYESGLLRMRSLFFTWLWGLLPPSSVFVNSGWQLSEARKATSKKNVAAESPDEADDRRSNPYINSHIVAYCLWRFLMLICQAIMESLVWIMD